MKIYTKLVEVVMFTSLYTCWDFRWCKINHIKALVDCALLICSLMKIEYELEFIRKIFCVSGYPGTCCTHDDTMFAKRYNLWVHTPIRKGVHLDDNFLGN